MRVNRPGIDGRSSWRFVWARTAAVLVAAGMTAALTPAVVTAQPAPAQPVPAQPLPVPPSGPAVLLTYAGDGLTVRILALDEEKGTVTGEIVRNGQAFPFSGRISEDGNAQIVRGQFKAGEQAFDFTTRQVGDEETVTFTSGATTYRLRPVAAGANPENAHPPERNPPEKMPPDRVPPKVDGVPPKVDGAAAQAGDIRLKRVTFPDVSTGAPVAYTAVTPADWKAEGTIEWQPHPGGTPFPQTKVTMKSPQGGKVEFLPAMYFSYVVAPGVAPPKGEPEPARFPDWLVDAMPRYNKAVSNVRLVSAKRNEKAEQAKAEMDRATGALVSPGTRYEVWMMVVDYDEAGVRKREESLLTFTTFQQFHGINGFHSQSWAIYPGAVLTAPVDSFDAQRLMLFQVAGTVRPTARWFTLSQKIIAENSRVRAEQVWDQIRRRGEQINQMTLTKADEEKYNKSFSSDESQRKRVQGIYETEDYKDSDGSRVVLPIHGKYKFSDGQGNYIVTDRYVKPGASWQEISPAGQ